jgi:purine-binding chemotaxis protein CheW
MGAAEIDVVAFRIGTQSFGIPVAQVDQVIHVAEIEPLADAPELIRGFVTIEAVVIPVVDLRRRHDGVWSKLELQQRLILARIPSRRFALLADDVAGVTRVHESGLTVCDASQLFSTAEEAQLDAAVQRCPT